MEIRNDMPVWAPTDAEMDEIRRRVSKERAKAVADFFGAVKRLLTQRHETRPAAEAPKFKTAFYY
ncbi:MAG: hypothetical protein KKB37_07150 [Alphaproteobacteria bacterium]|nr:hypothetical protein [Alphaproteobacteria bacterium]